MRNLTKIKKNQSNLHQEKQFWNFPNLFVKKQQNFAIKKNTSCDAAYSTISAQALVYERWNRMVASEQDSEPFFKWQFCSQKKKNQNFKIEALYHFGGFQFLEALCFWIFSKCKFDFFLFFGKNTQVFIIKKLGKKNTCQEWGIKKNYCQIWIFSF